MCESVAARRSFHVGACGTVCFGLVLIQAVPSPEVSTRWPRIRPCSCARWQGQKRAMAMACSTAGRHQALVVPSPGLDRTGWGTSVWGTTSPDPLGLGVCCPAVEGGAFPFLLPWLVSCNNDGRQSLGILDVGVMTPGRRGCMFGSSTSSCGRGGVSF